MNHNLRLLAAARRAMQRAYKELCLIWRMIQEGVDLALTFEHWKHRYWAHVLAVQIAEKRCV